MRIIGITGPSGAGKSLLCEYCAAHGIPHLDADAIYHELLLPPSEAVTALRSAFGDGILDDTGGIDRGALGHIVFQDEKKLALLNETVLAIVLREIRNRLDVLRAEGAETVAVDAPTLIESGFHRECDTVVVVLASEEARLARIMARDGLSREKALSRIRAQKNDEFYCASADAVLVNDKDRDALFEAFEALLAAMQRKETNE